MTERLYLLSGGDEFEIDLLSAKLTERRSLELNNELEFVAPAKSPLYKNAFIKYAINGTVRFRGPIYPIGGNQAITKWRAEPCLAIASGRYTPKIRYGTEPVSSDYSGLPIAYVFSSDPPVQVGDTLLDGSEAVAGDPMVHLAGLIWSMNSLVIPGLSTRSADAATGIITYSDLGTNSIAGENDVYFAGHLCTEVDALGDLTTDDYQIYRTGQYLKVYGTGAGDVYDPIYIDNYLDTYIRAGDLAKGEECMFSALDVAFTPFWPLLKDFLNNHGMYFVVREGADYTYIDGTLSPPGRGTYEYPAIKIRRTDYNNCDYLEALDPPTCAVVAKGRDGDWPEGERYVRADFKARGAWFSKLVDFGGASKSPFGVLETLGDNAWMETISDESLKIETSQNMARPSDWCEIELPGHGQKTMQVYEVESEAGNPLQTVKFGGVDSKILNAFIDEDTSDPILEMQMGAKQGSETGEDTFGNGDTFAMNWTPVAWTSRDTARVYFSLSADDETESDYRDLRVTLTVTVNGTVAAVLRDRLWGGEMIHKLPITDFCDLDGTQESLSVTVTDPMGVLNESIDCTGTVEGVGRYASSPIASIYPDGTSACTLTVVGGASADVVLADDSTARYVVAVGSSGYATCTLSTVSSMPDIATKVRVAGRCAKYPYGFNPFSLSYNYKARPYIVVGGSTYYGGWTELGLSYVDISADWETNPSDGEVWEKADIDSLSAGIEISGYYQPQYGAGKCCELRVDLL